MHNGGVIEIPLQLWDQPHWELQGRWDCALFFRRLPDVLPPAATLFIEGTSIATDVSGFLRSVAEPGDYLPMRQTLWPRAQRYRVRCDAPTLATLAELAEHHAEPELLDHLFVYGDSGALLEFPDAFLKDCPASFAAEIEEQRLRDFAKALGLKMTRAQPSESS